MKLQFYDVFIILCIFYNRHFQKKKKLYLFTNIYFFILFLHLDIIFIRYLSFSVFNFFFTIFHHYLYFIIIYIVKFILFILFSV